MNAMVFKACELLVEATVNAVLQGALVAALLGLALRFVRTNAATRHAVWWGILLIVAALVPANIGVGLLSHTAPTLPEAPPPSLTTTTPFAPPTPARAHETALAPLDGGLSSHPAEETDATDASAAPALPETGTAAPEISVEQTASWSQPSVPLPPTEAVARQSWRRWLTAAPAFWQSLQSQWRAALHLPPAASLAVVAAWVLLAAARLGMVAGRVVEIRQAKKRSAAAGSRSQDLFDKLRASARLRRDPQLRVSDEHPIAMALGFRRPVVLLPADLDKSGEDAEVEQVLRHELAHVSRRDDWSNLWQQIIEAALFFHPAIWWISPQLSLEREIACDDLVLEAGGRARGYALTLANAASRLRFHRDLAAPGVSGKNSQLQQRINMILNTQRDRSSRLAKRWPGVFTAAAAGFAALAIAAGPRLVLADTPAQRTPGDTATAADGTPAALPGGAATDSGPRTKTTWTAAVAPVAATPPTPPTPATPETPLIASTPPVADVAPAPPEPPSAPEPPAPPALALVAPAPMNAAVASASLPPVAMVTTDAPDNEDPTDDTTPAPGPRALRKDRHLSVEERLDRIEKMLAELKAHQDINGWHHMSSANAASRDGVNANISVQPDMKFDWVARETDRAVAQAKRAAEAGQRAAEQGQRAAEQAMREMAKLNDGDLMRMKQMQMDGSRQQLQALRQARESLQSQVRSLDEQIRRLEKDRARLDQDRGKDTDKDKGDSDKEEPTPQPSKE